MYHNSTVCNDQLEICENCIYTSGEKNCQMFNSKMLKVNKLKYTRLSATSEDSITHGYNDLGFTAWLLPSISKRTAHSSFSKETNHIFATWSLLAFTQHSFAALRAHSMMELDILSDIRTYSNLGLIDEIIPTEKMDILWPSGNCWPLKSCSSCFHFWKRFL